MNRRRGLPWPFALQQSVATAQAPGQVGSGCSRALFGQPLAALGGEDNTLPRPIHVSQPGHRVPSPPPGFSVEMVGVPGLQGQGTGLCTHSKEPALRQCSGHRCWKAAPPPSNCPPASPAGAPGCPVAGRTINRGDIPPVCQRDSSSGAAGGPGLWHRCRPGQPACAAAHCHLEGEHF